MRTIWLGLACSVLAFLVIISGQVLDIPIQNVLVGIAVGAVLGMVRTGSPGARFVGFLVGLLGGAAFYLLESFLFPQTWFGQAVAVAMTIMALAVVSALTRGWMHLWTMFLGTVAFAATYDGFFSSTPWLIQSKGPVLLGGMLFCVACGFLTAVLTEVLRSPDASIDAVDPLVATSGVVSAASSSSTVPEQASASGSLSSIGFDKGEETK